MGIAISYKVVSVYIIYRNINLLSGWIFSYHIDMGLRFVIALDYLLDIVDIVSIKSEKGFLNFKGTFCVAFVFGGLYI